MRELPRQLTADELAELFSGRTRLVERLADEADPLGRGEEILLAAPLEEQVEALAAHPRIGEPSEEQRGAEPEVLAELEATEPGLRGAVRLPLRRLRRRTHARRAPARAA